MGKLAQARRNSCCLHTHIPPRTSEPGLWLLMKVPGCLGELHRLPRGWQRWSQPGTG